jgi:hypothetical protein
MTDQPFPTNPPIKLVQQWKLNAPHPSNETEHYRYIAICAALWGKHQRGRINVAQLQERADQELKACCEQLDELQLGTCYPVTGDKLRAARRPKPPSLKERISAAITKGDERTALLLLNEALPND